MRKLILITILGLMVGLSANAAPVNFDIQFEQDPLFKNANFMPGDNIDRYIQVTNNTLDSAPAYIWATNVTDKDGMGDVLHLTVKEGTTTIYQDTLANFFSLDNLYLSDIAAGNTVTYILDVYFEEQTRNDYQEKSVGFDISIGFEQIGDDGEIYITHGGGGSCGDDCYSVTPTPTPLNGRGGEGPDKEEPKGSTGESPKDTSFDNVIVGTIGGEDEEDDEKTNGSIDLGSEEESGNNLFASLFGFMPCGYWLIILLFALMLLTVIDRGYELSRKIYMLIILVAILILAIMGYIPCNWWVILIITLSLIYLMFRKYKR